MLLLIVYKQELAANSCPPSKSLALYEELEELESWNGYPQLLTLPIPSPYRVLAVALKYDACATICLR